MTKDILTKRTITITLVALTVLYSCKSDKEEKAKIYYDSYLKVMQPYKTSTDKLIKESTYIIGRGQTIDGDVKLLKDDSLKISELFEDFNHETERALRDINKLDAFEEFDLKEPATEFIMRTSKILRDTYKQLLYHSLDKDYNPEQLALLGQEFKTEFIDTNIKFIQIQEDFQKMFGIKQTDK